MTDCALLDAPGMLSAYAEALRPLERLSPSEWAERYRFLKEGTTAKPGLWSNEVFPYLVGVMDAVEEAIRLGKRGLVVMKSGQGGGSESLINAWGWLQTYYPGPILYMISKDEIAREFGRERFSFIAETAEPLKRKHLSGRGSGELVHVKRFTDGKLVIQGGRSVLNLQSSPYRFVIIDEVDSLLDEIEGHGDPIKLAEIRLDAFPGDTLMVAFAHPSTKDRGAGKLYYELSDQRRPFVDCPHCDGEFWLSPDHLVVVPEGGETRYQAERNPDRYVYVAPCCGCVVTDSERYAVARGVRQKSTLEPEVAASKPWLGVSFNQLCMPNKPLRFLAEKLIEGLDDPATMRVVVNKRWGDVFEETVQETSEDAWRRLVVVPRSAEDPAVYTLGQVPPEVQFLTAGQDSNAEDLHWAVWGWGLVRDTAGFPQLCGWLIDAGVVERPERSPTLEPGDLQVLDQLLYDRAFPRVDGSGHLRVELGMHDSGWQPVAVYMYCRRRRASVPCKGSAADAESDAPFLRWGSELAWTYRGERFSDPLLRLANLNTYSLKSQWIGMVPKRFEAAPDKPHLPAEQRPRLYLPRDTPDRFLVESSSERLVVERRKKRWKARGGHHGQNHFSDCNVYAFAAALNLNPFQRGRTKADEERIEGARTRKGGGIRGGTRAAKHARKRGGDRRVRRSY